MTTAEGIQKYKEIYRQKTGIELTDEDAAEQAQRLLNLARIVFQPMPKSFEARYDALLKEHFDDPRMGIESSAEGTQVCPA